MKSSNENADKRNDVQHSIRGAIIAPIMVKCNIFYCEPHHNHPSRFIAHITTHEEIDCSVHVSSTDNIR